MVDIIPMGNYWFHGLEAGGAKSLEAIEKKI